MKIYVVVEDYPSDYSDDYGASDAIIAFKTKEKAEEYIDHINNNGIVKLLHINEVLLED